MNWALIRSIGNLTVLTRASYLILIIVPILAVLWPSVRSVLNGYNNSIEQTVLLLDNTARTLESSSEVIERLLSDDVKYNDSIAISSQRIISDLQNRIPGLIEESSRLSIKNTNLPSIWVLAFLASLSVFFAHGLYEFGVPEAVKVHSKRVYINSQVDLFFKNQSLRLLVEARKKLVKYGVEISEARHKLAIKSSLREEYIDENPENQRKAQVDILTPYFQIEYHELAKEKKSLCWSAFILYFIGLVFLLIITVSQTRNVLEAAGWI